MRSSIAKKNQKMYPPSSGSGVLQKKKITTTLASELSSK